MYSIYADGKMIYAPPVAEDGYQITAGKLTKQLNLADTFEFIVPPTGKGYDLISKMTTVITVMDDGEKVFHGRCLDYTDDWNNMRHYRCEGELGYLNDSVVRPYSMTAGQGWTPASAFQYFVTQHNSRVDTFKQFVVGDVSTMQDDTNIIRASAEYPSTMAEIQEKLIDEYGGYIVPRYVGDKIYLDYKKVSGGNNNQVIMFSSNILDMSRFIDASDVCTVLIPLGAAVQQEGSEESYPLTIESVNSGKDYLESSAGIATFGRIERAEYWDDVTIASNLLTKGRERLTEVIKEALTLEVNAIDLSLLNVEVDKLKIGEYNHVISAPHAVDDYFQCTRIVIDLANPSQNQYTFGNPRQTLSEQVAAIKLGRVISNGDIAAIIER